MIPVVGSWKSRSEARVISRVEPSSPAAEAYRSLRTSINFLGVDRSMRIIQVTSSNASEGKTTTIANLAVALARAGERVVIVNCDLRRPRVHEFFGLSDSVGFTNVFLGEMPISTAVQGVPGEPNLRLLASGKLPPNPSELLSSPRTDQIFLALKNQGAIVLVDCPPVLPVTDAAVLSSRVDGTVLVAAAGSTTSKDLARALELLHQVGAPIVGTVLNGVSAESGYGYQYGYYAGAPDEKPTNLRRSTKPDSRAPAPG
jgi:capsular exopolysaccharide synthesis family protein